MDINKKVIELAKEIYNNTGYGIKHSLKIAKGMLEDERRIDSATKVCDKRSAAFKQ